METTVTNFVPTTRITVDRSAATEDEYGELGDTPSVTIWDQIPAAIVQINKRVWSPSESRLTVLTTYTIRTRPQHVIKERDTITDSTGNVYNVTSTSVSIRAFQASDNRVEATLISS